MAFLAACTHAAPGDKPVLKPLPPDDEPPAKHEPTCSDAGIQLEAATRDLRPPDRAIAPALKQACSEAAWPAPAIACFATMTPDDLQRCAQLLSDAQRGAVFEALGGTDRGSVAVALVKLAGMQTGIAECDHFVATVALVLGCDAMPIETRVQLGVETADSWSLPASPRLTADMRARMGASCQRSLDALVAHAHGLGCL